MKHKNCKRDILLSKNGKIIIGCKKCLKAEMEKFKNERFK